MRADTHVGPEHDAPLQRSNTLLQHSRSSILEVPLAPHGRAIQHVASFRSNALGGRFRREPNRAPRVVVR
jgi:hypothetical protein